MTVEKVPSKGTQLLMEIATVWTPIARIMNIDDSGGETQYYESTALDSENVEDGEPTGMATPGEWSGELWYDPANAGHMALIAAKATKAKCNFKQVYANAGLDEKLCEATVKTFSTKAALGDGLRASFALKLTAPATDPS